MYINCFKKYKKNYFCIFAWKKRHELNTETTPEYINLQEEKKAKGSSK